MKTVTEVIAKFKRHYPGCDAATAGDLFATSFKRLLDKAKFRTGTTAFSSIVANQREYDWAEADNRVSVVVWYESETSYWALEPMSEDNLFDRSAEWKDTKQLGTAITISSATTATPTVVTTASAHGLTIGNNGSRANEVYLTGLNGVTDGYYFAKVTGTTTFEVYSDMADATAVAGTGASSTATVQLIVDKSGSPSSFYIAARTDATSNKTGKLVIGFDPAPDTSTTNGYPYALAHVSTHTAITGSTVIPYSLLDEMYFVYAMCEYYAYEEDIQKAPMWEKKRREEETIQLEHLKQLATESPQSKISPPRGPLTRRVV